MYLRHIPEHAPTPACPMTLVLPFRKGTKSIFVREYSALPRLYPFPPSFWTNDSKKVWNPFKNSLSSMSHSNHISHACCATFILNYSSPMDRFDSPSAYMQSWSGQRAYFRTHTKYDHFKCDSTLCMVNESSVPTLFPFASSFPS